MEKTISSVFVKNHSLERKMKKRRILTQFQKHEIHNEPLLFPKTPLLFTLIFHFSISKQRKTRQENLFLLRLKNLLYIHLWGVKTLFCPRKEKQGKTVQAMNLYDLQNNFWRIDEQKTFSGNDTRLYFYLLCLANRAFWKQEWIEFGEKQFDRLLIAAVSYTPDFKSRIYNRKNCG